ncbi:hypothetical protein YQE_02533, partial [Dendroctonus ponderosae]
MVRQLQRIVEWAWPRLRCSPLMPYFPKTIRSMYQNNT